MKSMRQTRLEHIIVFLVICAIAVTVAYFVVKTIVTSNAYFTEEGILKKVQIEHPEYVKSVDLYRSFWDKTPSKVYVEDEARRGQWFCFNTNIMANHRFVDCKQ